LKVENNTEPNVFNGLRTFCDYPQVHGWRDGYPYSYCRRIEEPEKKVWATVKKVWATVEEGGFSRPIDAMSIWASEGV
jgi:hypothetical protein